jgi:predicted MPP superfamily phosphohydrolase
MSEVNLARRKFLKGLAAAGLVGVAGVSAYASLIEPFNYELTETDIFLENLPQSFEGFRIAQLTDLHHSRLVPLGEVVRVVELAREATPA